MLLVYAQTLESQLQSETSGNFRRLLISLCSANRDESGHVDRQRARQDAVDLKEAGIDSMGTDESAFNAVICQRNYAQLRLICEEYESLTGKSLVKTIDSEFSGDVKVNVCKLIWLNNKFSFSFYIPTERPQIRRALRVQPTRVLCQVPLQQHGRNGNEGHPAGSGAGHSL